MKRLFTDRASFCKNPVAKQLLNIVAEKQSMLAVAVDLSDKKDFLKLVNLIGPKICLLKTHIDIVEHFDQQFVADIAALAKQHNFLIFEDRKFADIGTIAQKQYSDGVFKIADWAHIITTHALFGSGLIEGLKEVGLPKGRGALLLAELSAKGNLIDAEYTEQAVALAKQHQDFIMGFISQKRLIDDKAFIQMTPGVNIAEKGDALGQQYNTPEAAIKNGADIIIVGRGITEASDPLATAELYRQRAWDAYVVI
jgi:orotidine 5'-phosphate decarboxylase subfamily 1